MLGGSLVQLDDGFTTFNLPDGKQWQVELLGTIDAINEVTEGAAKAGESYLVSLKKVAAKLTELGAPALNLTQVDTIIKALELEFEARKKNHSDAIGAMRSLPNSTPSTPSA